MKESCMQNKNKYDSTFCDPVHSGGKLLAVVSVDTNFEEHSLGRRHVSADWQRLEFLKGQVLKGTHQTKGQ